MPTLNTDAVLASLAAFPRRIRQHIGPALSERLRDVGAMEASETVLHALARLDPQGSDGEAMATARLQDAKGERVEAAKTFEEISLSGGDDSAEALVDLVRVRFEERQAMEAKDVLLLDAYGMEYKGTSLEPQLADAKLLALALQGDFDAAFGSLDLSEDRDIAQDILLLLTERADNVTFLSHVLELPSGILDEVRPSTTRAMASRLLDIGFPDQAQLILDRASGPVDQERRLLQARISLGSGKPNQALVGLVGLLSDESDGLRADGYLQSERLLQAAALYRKSGAMNEAQRAFWLAGDNVSAGSLGDGKYGTLVELEERLQAPMPKDGQVGLTLVQNLLDQSANRREALTALLAVTAVAANTNSPAN